MNINNIDKFGLASALFLNFQRNLLYIIILHHSYIIRKIHVYYCVTAKRNGFTDINISGHLLKKKKTKLPLSLKLGNKYILIDVRTFAQYYNQGISLFIRHEFNVTYSTNLWWNDNFHGSFKSQLTNKSKSIINNWNCNTLYDPNVVYKSCMHYRFSLQHNGMFCSN